MKLVLVRHADAGDADSFARTGQPDHLRPLSPRGHEQMREAAHGLRAMIESCELIASSPYLRARSTAEVIRREYELSNVETTHALEPHAQPEDFERWMREMPRYDTAIIVGHEPNLAVLASWLCAGSHMPSVEFRKGGACLLAFGRRPRKGEGTLRWLMGPRELAAIGHAAIGAAQLEHAR